ELTATTVEPLYRLTLWFDRHRLAEIDAEIAGTPYQTEDQRWAVSRATFAASLSDPEVARGDSMIASLLATPTEGYARPGLVERVMRVAAAAPHHPIPGPDRRELLAAVEG